jgi:hypothetical protein
VSICRDNPNYITISVGINVHKAPIFIRVYITNLPAPFISFIKIVHYYDNKIRNYKIGRLYYKDNVEDKSS